MNIVYTSSGNSAPTSERLVPSGSLELWTQDFGDVADPTILLIMGAMNQGILWPDEFCHELVQRGFHVIRYDHRDTGQSSTVDFHSPYTLDDLAKDAVAVLDGYGVAKAHIVGFSMGGFIAQLLGLDRPDRVLTLTLLMTSPDHRVYMAATSGKNYDDYPLPPPAPAFLDYLATSRRNPPRNVEEDIANAVEGWRVSNGDGIPFDAAAMERVQRRVRARAKNLLAVFKHARAVTASPGRTERLSKIVAPTLVIHGRRDPCLPVEHGISLAKAIPGSKLVILPDLGHMLPPSQSARIAKIVLDHVAGKRPD
jgi:pimeloyl-ACP methyl ester carboxylesterase